MSKYKLTGLIDSIDFPNFLSKELREPRHNIKEFTSELMNLFKTDYLSLVNSGSSANFIAALTVKEVQKEKKTVLLSAFSFPTTVSSYSLLGFNVKLIDTAKGDFNISVEEIKKKINYNTAAVVITHFLGFPAALKEIKELCNKYGALLVQDACETMNLKVADKYIYEFGDIVTHSFYHPHHLSSYGGGAVIVNTEELFLKTESFIHWGRMCHCHINPAKCKAPHGISHNFFYERQGLNVEISELNACFGRFQLQTWKQQETTRKFRYNKLYKALNEFQFLKLVEDNFNISPFVFPIQILTSNFSEITEEIQNNSIEIRNLMGGGIHMQPGFKEFNDNSLINAEEISSNSFFIGIHQYIEKDSFEDMLNLLIEIFNKYE